MFRRAVPYQALVAVCFLSLIGPACQAQARSGPQIKPEAQVKAPEQPAPSDLTTTLPPSEVAVLFKPSRTPWRKDKITSWTPTAKDIQQVEADLPGLAKSAEETPLANHWPSRVNVMTFRRQYLGIVMNGQPLVYLNAFSPSVAPNFPEWRHHAVFVFDGGYAFFHATYDLKLHRFTEWDFNGFA